MISNITNLEELIAERNKLKIQLSITKEKLHGEVRALEEILTPSNLVMDIAKKVFSPPNSPAGHLITNAIGNIAANTLFGGVSWPFRFLLRIGTRNLASHLLVKNAPALIEKVSNFFSGKKKPVVIDIPYDSINK